MHGDFSKDLSEICDYFIEQEQRADTLDESERLLAYGKVVRAAKESIEFYKQVLKIIELDIGEKRLKEYEKKWYTLKVAKAREQLDLGGHDE